MNFKTLLSFRKIILASVYLFSIILISKYTMQSDFEHIYVYYSTLFLAYILLYKILSVEEIWTFTIALIFITFVINYNVIPNWSDDIYRYYWDGILVSSGFNPYDKLPSELLNSGIDGITSELYEKLNSPNYFSVYPPFAQLFFAIAAKFSCQFSGFVILLRLLYMIPFFLSAFALKGLLKRLNASANLGFLILCNPLILVEGLINLHLEMISVSLLILFLYYIQKSTKSHWIYYYALSIATKLNPLVLFPYLFKTILKSNPSLFLKFTLFSLVLFTGVFINANLSHLFKSIDLYFQNFEFNASIYYILRYVGFEYSGYNLIKYIGPLLALSSMIIITLKSFRLEDKFNFNRLLLIGTFAYFVLLIGSTIVHPWYLIPLVMFGTLVRFWPAIVWSYVIILSYHNYAGGVYYEDLRYIAIEYFLLFGSLLWWYQTRKRAQQITR
ncbi:MAG: hypothetical protein KDC16_09035 [Saprospiraceae bacterium]|nr:hypothetical protein [Saprospiraceae bacterium]MCB9327506.1 hypothetical protein [Lewinellaceae bacterium]